ncbi:MAG: hypothetical protein H0X65_00580 [Gemmatimonadetes bacterium]|nr:hypothetical protein [Gemmatimonadota bacterium]
MWIGLYDRIVEAAWKTGTRFSGSSASETAFSGHAPSTVHIRWPAHYQWALASQWVDGILREFRRHATVEVTDLVQTYPGIVLFSVENDKEQHEIAIDYSDYPVINEECADRCALYFKMQYAKEGYAWTQVVPGGFVPGKSELYSFLPHVRALRDRRTFVHDVYGRFGRNFATEVRKQATGILGNQDRFGYEGGLSKVRYSRSLREVARSRLCIDLPGNGAFCFRLVDYFAVGACVISYPHSNRMPVPLVDREHIVYCKEDFSDLPDLCAYYLENAEEREEICLRSREYFDKHLHRRALAAYYFDEMIERLGRAR